MNRVCALLGAIVAGSLVAASALALDREPAAYGGQVLDFMQRHCIAPVLENGMAEPAGLKQIRKHIKGREIHVDPTEENADAALTLTIHNPVGLAPFCRVHQTPAFWLDEIGKDVVLALAAAARGRISGYILREFDAGLAQIVRYCHADLLTSDIQRAPVAGAWLSEDGSRSVLIVLDTFLAAAPGVTAVELGPVADCGVQQ